MHAKKETLKPVADPARRTFFRNLGRLGLGAAATGLAMNGLPKLRAQGAGNAAASQETANQILTAALVAEDLAATCYYNGLIGAVIEDPNLAGPGGSARLPSVPSNVQNVAFLRAALAQEVSHASQLRLLGNLGSGSTDPYQTFYFPSDAFTTLNAFYGVVASIEAALAGAYLVAVREFAALAAQTASSVPDGPAGGPYSAAQLEYMAQVAASILGVEAEHRALSGVLLGQVQPNNLNYEQTGGILSVSGGSGSAMAALQDYLSPVDGPGYSLAVALAAAEDLGLPSVGNPPSYAQPSAQAYLTASPNPIPVLPGQDGVTTLSWYAPSSSIVQIRVGSPGGPLVTDNFNQGSITTPAWVTNGMTFYLQDATGGAPTLASNTLATVTVTLFVT